MSTRDDNPWTDLERIGGRMPAAQNSLERFAAQGRAAAWAPLADFIETKEAYVFEIELAGVRRRDIRLELMGNQLKVFGERLSDGQQGGVGHHLVERPRGWFSRAFDLPGDVDAEKAFASFGDGLLTVTLPKKNGARRIEIEVG